MAPMHGPTYGHGPIPFMAMAHSIHGHGPIPSMAKTPIHGQGPVTVAVAPYNFTWQTVAIYPVSHAWAYSLRGFRANRSNPGIKSYSRWGWFRGVAAVDRGDHGTSYVRIYIGHKWGYARIYGGKNGHVCAYLWQQQWPCECAYLWAMYTHIYGSSNGHECAYLWQQ